MKLSETRFTVNQLSFVSFRKNLSRNQHVDIMKESWVFSKNFSRSLEWLTFLLKRILGECFFKCIFIIPNERTKQSRSVPWKWLKVYYIFFPFAGLGRSLQRIKMNFFFLILQLSTISRKLPRGNFEGNENSFHFTFHILKVTQAMNVYIYTIIQNRSCL